MRSSDKIRHLMRQEVSVTNVPVHLNDYLDPIHFEGRWYIRTRADEVTTEAEIALVAPWLLYVGDHLYAEAIITETPGTWQETVQLIEKYGAEIMRESTTRRALCGDHSSLSGGCDCEVWLHSMLNCVGNNDDL